MRALKTFVVWTVIFAASYLALSSIGMVPPEIADINGSALDSLATAYATLRSIFPVTQTQLSAVAESTSTSASSYAVFEQVLPDRIVIPKIGIDDPVVNPETRAASVLDEALTRGVVRYPGSGGLDDVSNMFIFGHSTNWAVVHNQAYKSFNRLGELQLGDLITVYSSGTKYRYTVTSVALVDKNDALVQFKNGEKLLTLSTCDTFGAKSDRFVVQARFVDILPASQI